MTVVSIKEARSKIGRLIERAENGECDFWKEFKILLAKGIVPR